ncbi:MAG: thiamine pyrophosphate-dependent enzyme [Spirochaetota bacterium]
MENENAKLSAVGKRRLLLTMLRIREFEDSVGEMYLRGLTAGSMLHLSVGEEATAAGIGLTMQAGDYFTTHHRGHGIFIARGAKLDRMMAEIFGRVNGYCKGKGGSMHIADINLGHMGANAIVGANIPISLGGGFTLKYLKKKNVSVAFFDDGALNQGILYESMNMAALWKLPVMFAVVNNQYGMGTRIDRASACLKFVERAESFGVRGAEIDGMDVELVWKTANELLAYSRSGNGPTFLLANTYRYYGHGRKDPSPYRTKEEEKEWKARDPITLLKSRMFESGELTEEEYREMVEDVGSEVERAVEFAKESPVPEAEELYTDVFIED